MDKIKLGLIVFTLGIILAVVLGALIAFPIMWLWNALMPDIFGLPELTYLQSWGLYILSGLLIKSSNVNTNNNS